MINHDVESLKDKIKETIYTMATSNKVLVLYIVALVVCSFATNSFVVEGNTIDYGAMRRDVVSCRGQHCLPSESNNYACGCEKSEDCRSDEPSKTVETRVN